MAKYIDADKVIDYANQEVSSPFFSIGEGAEDVVTYKNKWAFVKQVMIGMPAADVVEMTLENAIDYLHSIGWMQEHDRQMMEMGQEGDEVTE